MEAIEARVKRSQLITFDIIDRTYEAQRKADFDAKVLKPYYISEMMLEEKRLNKKAADFTDAEKDAFTKWFMIKYYKDNKLNI